MASELGHIGIQDTPQNRAYVEAHLRQVINNPNNVAGTGVRSYIAKDIPGQPVIQYTATVRESFLMGPGGGVKFETVWDGNRLLTAIIKGG